MKFEGRHLSRYTGTVTLVRGEGDDLHQINIRVQQLPVTWQEECERMLPPPTPPVVGKVYEGGEEKPKYNEDDPKYKAEAEQWEHRTWAKKIYDATIDENVQWETDPKLLEDSPGSFYDAIFGELSETFSRGEISRWLFTVNAIDQVGGADVALAEQGLFQVVKGLLELPGLETDTATDADAVRDEVP